MTANPSYDFSGLVALVTGASAGIGFATARAFAESGASVVLADIDGEGAVAAAARLATAGHTAIGLACDVTDDAQVAALIAKVVETYGRLDMAFNNAGIAGPSGIFTEETVEGFDAVNSVNLRGVWSCMKHEVIQMEKQGGGAIVNCSSLGGLVGLPGRAAYHGTKHAVLGLTKSVGVEYASRGIRVNAVCPGVVETPMLGDLVARSAEAMEEIQRNQPIGRLGRPEEIAAAVLWLCSSAASFVAGAYLSVDGGFVAH